MNDLLYDGTSLLEAAMAKHKIDLAVLVAETSLWANPEVHRFLIQENGTGAWRPGTRRARAGETRRTAVGDVILDDNSAANNAIKTAIGIRRTAITSYETCHIWPDTCYDERYHTAIANLVLLPRALAGLSDHSASIRSVLQFRAFELYNWVPEGREAPTPPPFYPTSWRVPFAFTDRIQRSLRTRRA